MYLKKYKDARKDKLDLDLVQCSGPKDDAPEAGFDNGEAYKGNWESSGVPGMLDVIKPDFECTINEEKKAENDANQDHVASQKEAAKGLKHK